jgi:hypothetical protein
VEHDFVCNFRQEVEYDWEEADRFMIEAPNRPKPAAPKPKNGLNLPSQESIS